MSKEFLTITYCPLFLSFLFLLVLLLIFIFFSVVVVFFVYICIHFFESTTQEKARGESEIWIKTKDKKRDAVGVGNL